MSRPPLWWPSRHHQIKSKGINQYQLKLNNQKYNDKYNQEYPLLSMAKNLDFDDWLDVAKSTLGGIGFGAEKMSDAMTLGMSSLVDKHTSNDYANRNQQYHQAAQDAGISDWAKFNDRIIDTVGGYSPLANFMMKPYNSATKLGGLVAGDIGISGTMNTMRKGNDNIMQNFSEGGMDSNFLKILEYLLKMLDKY